MLPKFLSKSGCKLGNAAKTAAALLPLLLCQCDDGSSARIRGLKDEIQTLNHQIDDTRSQVSRLQSQIEASRAEKKKLEEDKAKSQEEREATAKELEQLKKDFETYKSHYKLSMRKRAPGFQLEDFTSVDGKEYKQVVLREITETQVNFTHQGGIMKLHYKQLPEQLQAVLGFLIAQPEAPRDTKVQTPRQINAERRSAKEALLLDAESKLKDLRVQRERSLASQSNTRQKLRNAESNGEPVLKLTQELEMITLYLNQLNNLILKAEVDVHRVRAEPVKLVPEK